MWKTFVDRAKKRATETSACILWLSPDIKRLPLPIQRFDDPYLPFTRSIVEATQDLVAGYLLDFAAYLSLGAAGARALERSIGLVDNAALKILHGPFVGPDYSAMMEPTSLAVDAATVCFLTDLEHYLSNAPYAAFLLEKRGNRALQRGGIIDLADRSLNLFEDTQVVGELKLIDREILYTSKSNDFAEAVRARILECL